ncbi:type VII secretion integral membrane protein EccD [Mycolicibacillus trivialis]|uniref:type VII secretion integral membrane protein EccD n=1 Tax=Mycolicibacillus trivialis TaxID=1798 RepID=UPI000A15D951|nr:type VII secretion integral membrane protein EccD [Mycolicibacillus trivialis]
MTTAPAPARCAVAVVCGPHLISQVLPAAVPVEMFLDDVVELVDDELKRRGQPGLAAGAGYRLHRVDGTRLDASKPLDDLGVEDGAALVLAEAEAGEPFEPHYESLSTGLARAGKRLIEPVSAQTALHTALAVLAGSVAATVGLALRARCAGAVVMPASVTALPGLLMAAGAIATRRRHPARHDLGAGLGWAALPLLACGLAVAAPGELGAPHGFIAALAVVVGGCLAPATARWQRTTAAALVTVAGLATAATAVRMWQPVPARLLGIGGLIVLLLLLTFAPTIALRAAHIRPPQFGSITGRDLFHHRAGLPSDAVTPVDVDHGETDPAATPGGARIAELALRAHSVLTGCCVGAALSLPVATWATLAPRPSAATTVLVALFVVIFLSRARALAARAQAVALAGGAATTIGTVIVAYVVDQPPTAAPALAAAVAALFGVAAAGLLAAALIPPATFTPLVRMAAEWAELGAIVVAVPLAAWIGGLFTWVRMR